MSGDQVRARALEQPVHAVLRVAQRMIGRFRDERVRLLRQISDLTQERDLSRDVTQALEEENALLLWLHAEAVWKEQNTTEAYRRALREALDESPAPGWRFPPRSDALPVDQVSKKRRREAHSVWVMGKCACGVECEGGAAWAQHQYEVDAWVPGVGERVTATTRAVPPNTITGLYSGRIRDTARIETDDGINRYVDFDTLRPASSGTAEPRVWECRHEPNPDDVRKVRDEEGDIWTLGEDGQWHYDDRYSYGWGRLVSEFGPITEVIGDAR